MSAEKGMIMRNTGIAMISAIALTACGSQPAPAPTEQIIVRAPGEAAIVAVSATKETAAESAGKTAFAVCVVCHSVDAGAPASIGPNLYGVVGRAAGSAEGFGFSEALKSSGISWTEAELDAFIADPTGKVPGTTMATGAVSDNARRKAIINYLKNSAE